MITADRLRELLSYDPTTGEFTWRVRLGPAGPVGSRAGTIYKNGRRYIAIDRKRYFAARLAWLHVHGCWPSRQVDHRNLDRADDRLENLRLATGQLNAANRRVSKNNRLGVKGVGISTLRKRKPQRYRARIRVNDRLIHLGYFDTPEEANDAYAAAARKHFGEFARSA